MRAEPLHAKTEPHRTFLDSQNCGSGKCEGASTIQSAKQENKKNKCIYIPDGRRGPEVLQGPATHRKLSLSEVGENGQKVGEMMSVLTLSTKSDRPKRIIRSNQRKKIPIPRPLPNLFPTLGREE